MNIWANAVITQKGLALQAKLIKGTTLTITKGVTGAGFVTPGLLSQQTAVSGPKQEFSFRPVTYPEEGKCAVNGSLTNDDLTTGYTAMQVGFYATDPDEGEILYFIAQAESGTGTAVPSKTEMPGFSAEWTFYFQYGQADGVNVTVDPANTISRAELEAGLKEKADVNLSNVADVVFAEKASKAGVGGTPIVPATSTDGATYTATVTGVTTLTKGLTLTIIPNTASTNANVKLNVNGLGDKFIRMRTGYNTTTTASGAIAGWLSASKPIQIQYDGTYWVADLQRTSANSITGTVAIENGGTGASTAPQALANLGAAAANHTHAIVLFSYNLT